MLLPEKLTSVHTAAIIALVSSYKNGSQSDKIRATMSLADYTNKHHLTADIICATCSGADKLMQAAIATVSNLVEEAPAKTTKFQRASAKKEILPATAKEASEDIINNDNNE